MITQTRGGWGAVLVAFFVLAGAFAVAAQGGGAESTPAAVLKQYLQAVYARDYRSAYAFLSANDRRSKTEEEYVRDNLSFTGAALDLSRHLADLLELRNVRTTRHGKRATVRFSIRLPDANSPALQKLFHDFDPDVLAGLSGEERQAVKARLAEMKRQGTAPMIEGEESAELLLEPDGWKVTEDLEQAIPVHFGAAVKAGLPWEFFPVREIVRARPGETLQAEYRVKNLSDTPVTAKARHRDEPRDLAAKYLEIVQCFCFIRQTLEPGEEKTLPLIFRVSADVSPDVEAFRVDYEFYPIDKFPAQ